MAWLLFASSVTASTSPTIKKRKKSALTLQAAVLAKTSPEFSKDPDTTRNKQNTRQSARCICLRAEKILESIFHVQVESSHLLLFYCLSKTSPRNLTITRALIY